MISADLMLGQMVGEAGGSLNRIDTFGIVMRVLIIRGDDVTIHPP